MLLEVCFISIPFCKTLLLDVRADIVLQQKLGGCKRSLAKETPYVGETGRSLQIIFRNQYVRCDQP